MRQRLGRPSPATVLAVIALCVALGGSALAATKIGSKQIKRNAIKTKKIRDGAVTTPKLGDQVVTTPKLGDGAVTEQKLSGGAKTSPGYAQVSGATGAFSRAKGVIGVDNPSSGRFCFNLSFTPNNAVASAAGSATIGTTAQVSVPAGAVCDPPFNDAVVFTSIPPATSANRDFYVQFE